MHPYGPKFILQWDLPLLLLNKTSKFSSDQGCFYFFFPARHQSLCSDHYYILRRSRKELPDNVSQQKSSTSLCRVLGLDDSVASGVRHSRFVTLIQERVPGYCY